MKEATFSLPFDIPRNPTAKWQLKHYLESLRSQVGVWGDEGEPVGIGFRWETQTGLDEHGLSALITLARRLARAFLASGIIHPRARLYLLTCRIHFTRAEPSATITLKKGD